MKKLICALLTLLLLTAPALAVAPLTDGDIAISAPSAVLMSHILQIWIFFFRFAIVGGESVAAPLSGGLRVDALLGGGRRGG